MSYFALYGVNTHTLLTFRGRALFHDNRAELEFLFPGTKVVQVSAAELAAASVAAGPMHIAQHPGMVTIKWPLKREDFR